MSLNLQVSGYSSVVATKNQVSSELAGEAVILNFKSGKYYGLNAVGVRVWNLLQQPTTVNNIHNTLLEEYQVDPECCAHDIVALLQNLANEGLIEVRNETVA